MDLAFFTGLLGSVILVSGAAWPEAKTIPVKSIKNWLLAIGALIMFVYSIFGYQAGGPIFFVFLEGLVIVASVFMMLNVADRWDALIIGGSGLGFIAWSLTMFEGYHTVFFILGLTGVGLGYALKMGSLQRNVCLTLGSILIAIFSFLEASWIFFWLNTFFAIFSGYFLIKNLTSKK